MDMLYGDRSVYYAMSEKGEGIYLVCYENFHWPVKIFYSMSIL